MGTKPFLTSLALLASLLLHAPTNAAVLHRRALTVGEITRELSHYTGRDFCYSYLSETPLLFPSLVVDETTFVNNRKSTVNELYTVTVQTTSTNTRTTTRTAWVTETLDLGDGGTSTVLVTPDWTDYSDYSTTTTHTETYPDETTTVTETLTITPELELPVHRRQEEPTVTAIPIPSFLQDSDPASISAACTRVINKYPKLQISEGTSTRTTRTTTYRTTVTETSTFTTKFYKPAVGKNYFTITTTETETRGVEPTTTTVTVPAATSIYTYLERVTERIWGATVTTILTVTP